MTFRLGRVAITALLVWSTLPARADPAPSGPPKAPGPQADGAKGDSAKPDVAKPDLAKPDVATLLFGTPQWDKAPAGSKLRYTYEKTVAEASFGTSFKDEVVLTLGAGDDAKSRTTEMQLFSGANRRPAGPFRSDDQNPVLLVVLEDNIQELSKLFKANPRYLKNAVRKAWRDAAKIEPVTLTVDGKSVQGTRVAVTPFKGDAEADRMKGLADMTYVVDASPDVPGYIAAIDIRAPGEGKPLFAETLHFASISAATEAKTSESKAPDAKPTEAKP